jgi:hypothetical protein
MGRGGLVRRHGLGSAGTDRLVGLERVGVAWRGLASQHGQGRARVGLDGRCGLGWSGEVGLGLSIWLGLVRPGEARVGLSVRCGGGRLGLGCHPSLRLIGLPGRRWGTAS